jgi:diguanylate cyclase (GGDEF)-like protein
MTDVNLDFIFEKVLCGENTIILDDDDPLLDEISFISNSKSWFGVPLLFNNILSGCMILENTDKMLYNDFEISIAKTFAEYASIAISKANLFNQVNVLATIDSLSGLYNRRYFFSVSEKIFSQSKQSGDSISLLMIDIDFFKKINDTYGHSVGDEVIRFLGSNIKNFIRKTDIICRYGGEEFTLLLPDSEIKIAVEIGERIRKFFQDSFVLASDQKISFTVSIGISTKDASTESLNDLLIKADKMLYEAKNNGRNQIGY